MALRKEPRSGDVVRALRAQASQQKARLLSRFFKTGKGEYGEGDVFWGVMVPRTRAIVRTFAQLPEKEITALLRSPYHEVRLAALLMLVYRFEHGDERIRRHVVAYYLRHTQYINNWDLVDLSAHKILGAYLVDHTSMTTLTRLARSANMWERRIAVISTFAFINIGSHKEALRVAGMLLNDEEDLIHKAVGWMLREVGKRCGQYLEEQFLKKHYRTMPRTMLRYAIERFPKKRRQKYLLGTV